MPNFAVGDAGSPASKDPAVGSSPFWLERLNSVLGPTGQPRPLSANAWLVEAGRCTFVAKLGCGVQDEADGLRRIHEVPGSPPVPEVVMVEADLLVTSAVELANRAPAHEEALGRTLATMHRAPFHHWGGGSEPAPSTRHAGPMAPPSTAPDSGSSLRGAACVTS
jgi:hypothetical protein